MQPPRRLRSSGGRRTLSLCALAAWLGISAACGDSSGGSPEARVADGPPAQGGTAVIAENGDINQPMPLLIRSAVDGDLQDILYMGLYRMAWEEGRAVERFADESPMALARRYEFLGSDSAAIRFHLRSDVRWSDGEPMNAHDVVWTFETMMDPQLRSPRRDYVQHMDSVVAQNDSTVTFYFRRQYAGMLFHTGHGLAPRHVYADHPVAGLETHPSQQNPAGNLVVSGAFQIGAWERNQQIVLVPNPHFQPRPHLDRIVIRVIPDETTRLVELRTGGIDAMRISSPANLAPLREEPQIRLETIERRFSDFVGYNPNVEPLGDAEIRRALGLAIDVPAIIEALELTGYADRAVSAYSPIFAELQDPQLTPLPYDPDRARQILEQKGWVDGDGDGIRERSGRALRFNLLTSTGNQRRADVATMLQRYWREVGVEVNLQQQEFQTFQSRLLEKDFEAVVFGWQVSLSPDISGTWGPDAEFNFVSYRDPVLQAAMDSALMQRTEEGAAPYWKVAARQIARDQPYTWLYYMDQVVALRDRIRGTEIDTFGLYQDVWDWWIPADQQATR